MISLESSTAHHYRKAIRAFLASIGPRTDKSLAGIGVADIERFRDERTQQGLSTTTVRQDVETIRGVLNTARRQGLILHNPAEAVELPAAGGQERDILTVDDVRALLRVAPPEWRTVILIGFYVGARLTDAASLSWDRVDLAEGTITYAQAKTGKKVEIPIHPDLAEHLSSIAGDSPGFLCPTLATQKTGGDNGLSSQFGRLMDQAGIDRRQVAVGRKRKFSQVSYHSLRHAFATYLAKERVSADARMKLTGHKSLEIHQRYTHMELAALRQAIDVLPRL